MKYAGVFLCLSVVFAGCATTPKPEASQLEMRAFQTKEFAVADMAVIMKAMINALQDDGYILKSADKDLGFLTATREVDVENKTAAALSGIATALGGRSDSTWKKNAIDECSANITVAGEVSKVRVIFQRKVMDNRGGVVEVAQVDNEQTYVDFFNKVDKSIFIEKEKI